MIEVDDAGHAVRLVTPDRLVLAGRHICAPVQLGSPVVQAGRTLGRSLLEPLMELDDGRVLSLIGQSTMRVPYTDEEI